MVDELVAAALGRVLGDHGPVAVLQCLADAVEHEHIALVHAVVVAGVRELEREDAEVHEVLPVDAGEVLGDHGLESKEARRDGRVLPARALAVVLAADDDVAAGVAHVEGALRERLVDGVEHELGHLGDVAPEGQRPLAGGHDLVGRHIVAHLQKHRSLDAFGQRFEVREGPDVGTLDQLDAIARLRRRHQHLGVDDLVLRRFDVRSLEPEEVFEGAGVGDLAGERRCRGRLR